MAEFFAEDGSLTINRAAPAIGRAAIADAALGFMTAFPDLVVVMNGLGVSGYEEWRFGPDSRIARSLGYFDEAAYRAQLQGTAESSMNPSSTAQGAR